MESIWRFPDMVPLLGTLLGKIHPGDPGGESGFRDLESRRFTNGLV